MHLQHEKPDLVHLCRVKRIGWLSSGLTSQLQMFPSLEKSILLFPTPSSSTSWATDAPHLSYCGPHHACLHSWGCGTGPETVFEPPGWNGASRGVPFPGCRVRATTPARRCQPAPSRAGGSGARQAPRPAQVRGTAQG